MRKTHTTERSIPDQRPRRIWYSTVDRNDHLAIIWVLPQSQMERVTPTGLFDATDTDDNRVNGFHKLRYHTYYDCMHPFGA